MITKERLDEWADTFSPASLDCFDPTVRECKELIRLARLGIWAREYGVPALQTAELLGDDEVFNAAKDALDQLEKLPKELP